MNEFWAAIAGAIVGGIIALGIQLIALRANRLDREAEAAATRKALGHALLFKSIRLYSHLRILNLHLAEGRKGASGGKLVWQVVLPIANSPDRIHFTTDEMVMLLALNDNETFNDLIEMDEQHNATITAFEIYRDRRQTLAELLTPSKVTGAVGTIELTEGEMRALTPRMVELDMLLEATAAQSEQQEREAKHVLGRLRDLLVTKVGLTISIADKSPEELLPGRQKPANV